MPSAASSPWAFTSSTRRRRVSGSRMAFSRPSRSSLRSSFQPSVRKKLLVESPPTPPPLRGTVTEVTFSPSARMAFTRSSIRSTPISAAVLNSAPRAVRASSRMRSSSASKSRKSDTVCMMPPAAPTSFATARSSSRCANVPGIERPSGSRCPGRRLVEKPTAPSRTDWPASSAICRTSSSVAGSSTARSPMT